MDPDIAAGIHATVLQQLATAIWEIDHVREELDGLLGFIEDFDLADDAGTEGRHPASAVLVCVEYRLRVLLGEATISITTTTVSKGAPSAEYRLSATDCPTPQRAIEQIRGAYRELLTICEMNSRTSVQADDQQSKGIVE